MLNNSAKNNSNSATAQAQCRASAKRKRKAAVDNIVRRAIVKHKQSAMQ
jgi:hypothetical protein